MISDTFRSIAVRFRLVGSTEIAAAFPRFWLSSGRVTPGFVSMVSIGFVWVVAIGLCLFTVDGFRLAGSTRTNTAFLRLRVGGAILVWDVIRFCLVREASFSCRNTVQWGYHSVDFSVGLIFSFCSDSVVFPPATSYFRGIIRSFSGNASFSSS